MDEDRLLLERWQGKSSGAWVIRRDGTGLTQLANGTYLGAIR